MTNYMSMTMSWSVHFCFGALVKITTVHYRYIFHFHEESTAKTNSFVILGNVASADVDDPKYMRVKIIGEDYSYEHEDAEVLYDQPQLVIKSLAESTDNLPHSLFDDPGYDKGLQGIPHPPPPPEEAHVRESKEGVYDTLQARDNTSGDEECEGLREEGVDGMAEVTGSLDSLLDYVEEELQEVNANYS